MFFEPHFKKNKFFFSVILVPFLITSFNAQPKLEIRGGLSVTLGDVYEGRIITRDVILKNTGSDTLLIDSLRTSCGCTVAKLGSKIIPPAGRTTMLLSFDTNDLVGKFKRRIFIKTNDPSRRETVLTFGMNIVAVIEVVPRYISFGKVQLNQKVEKIIRLQNDLNDTIRILNYKTDEPQISLHMRDRVIKPNNSVELEVTLVTTKPGKLLGEVAVRTNNKLKPDVKISYIGEVAKQKIH